MPETSDSRAYWPYWLCAGGAAAVITLGMRWLALGPRGLAPGSWDDMLFHFLLVFAPLGFLALAGARAWQAWAAAIAFDLIFWGGFAAIGAGLRH